MKFPLTIRPDWEVEAKPISDRFLPNHPQNLRGKLPFWYLRTRFKQYGTIDYDLPNRGLTRNPDYGEALYIHHSALAALGTTYFGLGAVLPYSPDIFYRAFWELDTEKEELIAGEKIDPDAPWAFRYFDDYPQNFTAGNYRLKISFLSVNKHGFATAEILTNVNNAAGVAIATGELKKDVNWQFTITTPGNYFLRITTGSTYAHLLEEIL